MVEPSRVKQESKKEVKEEENKEDEVIGQARSPAQIRETPRQNSLQQEIAQCTVEITALKTLLSGPNPRAADREALKIQIKKKDKCIAALKRCRSLQKASRKHRRKMAKIMDSIERPMRPFPGRPALEEYNQ